MTYSGLVTWVKDWFDDPGNINTPSKDRIAVHQAVVLLIRGLLRGDYSSKLERRVHEYLTYLLLGWNPITAWPKQSEFEDPGTEQMDEWQSCSDAFKNLLDFDNCKPTSIYPLLICLSRWCERFGNTSSSLFVGERVTMMILALWLADRKCNGYRCLANDLGSVRACLDLYHRHKGIAVGTVDHEYASTNHELHYCLWIKKQMDRLLRLDIPSETFRSTMSYLGWFASLVIMVRTTKAASRCQSWIFDTGGALETEVIGLKETLDASALNCNPDQVRDGTRLFRIFSKNPPPVNERFKLKHEP